MPVAAAACFSSSFNSPSAMPRWRRPTAMAPDETIKTLWPRPWQRAMSAPRDFQPAPVDGAVIGVHQQGRADLHHHPASLVQAGIFPGHRTRASGPVSRIRLMSALRRPGTPESATPETHLTAAPETSARAAEAVAIESGSRASHLFSATISGFAARPARRLPAPGARSGRPRHVAAGSVHQMEQHRAAFHVAEEADAEAGAFVGPFDQAGDVGEDEL